MRKKIVSLFSAAALFITLVCTAFVNVSAAGEVKVSAATDLTTVKQGGTVRVDLTLEENPGLSGIVVEVVFDNTVFEYDDFDDKMLFGNRFQCIDTDGEDANETGLFALDWVTFRTNNDSTNTGLLASVFLKVKTNADDGNYTIGVNIKDGSVVGSDLVTAIPVSSDPITIPAIKVSDGRSDDATLKSLVLSNKNVSLNPAFAPDTEDYTVLLPNGSAVPKVTPTKNHAKATIQTTQATSFNTGSNVATIVVTAEKGNTKTYTVTFTEMNALLSSLKVDGTSVTGFNSNKTDYTYTVSYADWKADPTKTYAVTATASKEDSTFAISEENVTLTSTDPTKNTDKNVTVTVTSAQGDTTTYTIKFTVLACVHNYVLDATKSTPANCTDAGTNVSVCSVCGGEKEDTVNALGHNRNVDWVTVEPTCEVDGSKTKTCDRPGCNTVIDSRVLPKTGHSWSLWTNEEGTGNYTRTCSKCNETQTRTLSNDHEHAVNNSDQIEILKPATCYEKGLRRKWCAIEGCAEHIDEDIDMLLHTERTEREEPTCTAEGRQRVVCAVPECNYETEWAVIDALGHDWSDAWTTDDNDHWHVCRRCNSADDVNDREAHTENEGVVTTPATTVSNGIKTYSCTVCGKAMRTEVLPIISSNEDSDLNVPAEPYVGAPILPFGGISTESVSVKVENAVTGKTSNARAQRNGSSVSLKLGAENNGYYANVFTTDGEYIYSALIEGGKADFNAPSDVKIKIVIDSIAYGEDVSSAAAAEIESADILSGNTAVYLAGAVLLAAAAVMTVFIKKRANK